MTLPRGARAARRRVATRRARARAALERRRQDMEEHAADASEAAKAARRRGGRAPPSRSPAFGGERRDPGADVPLRAAAARAPRRLLPPLAPPRRPRAAIAASPSRVGCVSPASSSAFARLARGTAAPRSRAGGGRTPSSAARDHVRDAIGPLRRRRCRPRRLSPCQHAVRGVGRSLESPTRHAASRGSAPRGDMTSRHPPCADLSLDEYVYLD